MKTRSGHTLVELMLGIFLLGMLLFLLFVIFEQGWAAWRQASLRNDLANQSRQVVDSLTREMQSSIYESVSIQGEAVSFLSARDDSGASVLDGSGNLVWQRYVLYYRDDPTRRVLRCEVPVAGGVDPPVPIETALGNPLTTYLAPQRLIADRVRSLTLEVPAGSRRVEFQVEVEQMQRHGLPPALLTVGSGILFRNR